jgi:hypothetical protein
VALKEAIKPKVYLLSETEILDVLQAYRDAPHTIDAQLFYDVKAETDKILR